MAVRRLAEIQPESFDFTPENRTWVDRQIKKYPPGRQASAVMALLRRAQVQHDGWLPKPAIEKVAAILGMPYIRVLEVATFYSMYNLSPVGKYFIQFCGTTPCVLRGANDIKAVLESKVGPQSHVSEDGKFSWLEVECLGACCNAPMVQINDDYYEDLTTENFTTLLDDLAAGRAVRQGSQTGRLTSEPVGGLTSLTTFYGVDGRATALRPTRSADDAQVLSAANQDPAFDAAWRLTTVGSRRGRRRAGQGGAGSRSRRTGRSARSRDRAPGRLRRRDRDATEDPVGTNQAESSAIHKPPVDDGASKTDKA